MWLNPKPNVALECVSTNDQMIQFNVVPPIEMKDCSNANTRKAGKCSFFICKEQADVECKFCQTNLILNIEGCSCDEFDSEYEANFFIRGQTGQSSFNENSKELKNDAFR